MKLYILRHAIADDRDESKYADDSQRPLTKEGIRKMKTIAASLRDLDPQIDLIYTSPFLRAAETAAILRKTLGLPSEHLFLSSHLTPDGDPRALIEELGQNEGVKEVVLVGHEPYLSELISILISGEPSISIVLKKGGFCCLSSDELTFGKCARMEWLFTPRILTRN